MTIVVYECDTCNRTIERQQNKHGMDFVGRCVITNGCKGDLHLTKVKPAHVIPSIPNRVEGLDDWIQRAVLYTHEQTIRSEVWYIQHNLGSEPSTQVFMDITLGDGSEGQEEIVPDLITVLSPNEIEISFDAHTSGTAQCLARSSAVGQSVTYLKTEPPSGITGVSTNSYQMSHRQVLTLAVNDSLPPETVITGTVHFVSPTTLIEVTIPITYTIGSLIRTPWFGVTQVSIAGKLYTVFTGVIDPTQHDLLFKLDEGSAIFFEFDNQNDELLESSAFLLTEAPYEAADKNYTEYATLAGTNITNATAAMVLKDNEISGLDSIKNSTYPPIRITK